LSNYVDLDRIRRATAEKPEGDSVPAGDIFDKAFSSVELARADEAKTIGIYPYFQPISAQHGGTATVDGREMIITGSND
jgi:hypothetical protein